MRTRTVLYIPDPFAADPLPIAVLVETAARASVEPIPVLADLAPAARALIAMALDDIREGTSVDMLPIGCGPQVVLGPMHDPFKSLPPPVFDAIGRVLDRPEYVVELTAALLQGHREVYGYRCAS